MSRELVMLVREVHELHQRKDETISKLLKLCLKHLMNKDKPELQQERIELIHALEQYLIVKGAFGGVK